MKIITLVTIAFFFAFNGVAQVKLLPESESGLVEYRSTVEVTVSKEEIHNRLKGWIAVSFDNPESVIKMDDIANGILKLKFSTPFPEYNEGLFTSLLIEFKDNKYRYTFSDIYLPTNPQFQHNLTAEGINRRIKEKTDKGKQPMDFLITYVRIADATISSLEKSLGSAIATANDF